MDLNTRIVDVAIPAYNVAHCIGPTLDAILAQALPPTTELRIHVADDASSDGLSAMIESRYASCVELTVHRTNRGRSAACNSAIASGSGDIVIVLDADCRFADARMVWRMLQRLDAGADAVLGTVDAEGDGFWATYAGVVSARRVRLAAHDGPWHMTTANFAIRRGVLARLGGFDERYRHYGFEDRDLLIRLVRDGANVVVDPGIVVLHREPDSVHEVSRKLYLSGRHTASEFAARFPAEYRRSAYSRVDLSNHALLARMLSPLLGLLAPLAQRTSDAIIRQGWLHTGLKSFSLRVASALAYLHGTCDAAADNRRR